jgi:hypothetical protein
VTKVNELESSIWPPGAPPLAEAAAYEVDGLCRHAGPAALGRIRSTRHRATAVARSFGDTDGLG